MKNLKMQVIHKNKAIKMFQSMFHEKQRFTDYYLDSMEEKVFSFRNYEMMAHVILHERDERRQFGLMIEIARKNILRIFTNIDIFSYKKVKYCFRNEDIHS